MIRRPTCAGRLNATEPKFSQIEGRNEGVDHANRIVVCNPVIQAFRQQSRLPAISPLNKTRHAQPRRFSARIIAGTAFSHSQGQKRRSRPIRQMSAHLLRAAEWQTSLNRRLGPTQTFDE